MNLGALIREYRVLSQDDAVPPFCDNDELRKWFNDAEAEAAIRSRLIHDSDELKVSIGEKRYDIPPGLFEITYIEVCDSAGKLYPIKPTTRDVLDAAKPDWRRAVGRPEWYILDDTSLLLGAVPDTEYVLYIEFLRIPRNPMKALTDVPEIHEAHHDGLIQWALHKAFSKPDSDLFDPARSKEAEAAFTRQFGKRPTADLRKRQNANRPHRNKLHW